MLRSILNRIRRQLSSRKASSHRYTARLRPQLEILEDRLVPASLQPTYLGNLAETVAGSSTLGASVAGQSVLSNTHVVKATAPANMTFLTQPPASVSDDTTFGTVVAVTDHSGNPVAGVTVTLHLVAGHRGKPVTAKTDAAGQAVFSNLSEGRTGTYRLKASVARLSSVESDQYNVKAGAAAHVAIQLPVSVIAGDSFSATVTVTDAKGNPVSGATVALNIGGSAQTNATGVAVITPPVLTKAGDYSVQAGVAGLSTQTLRLTVKPAAPYKIVFTTQPPWTANVGTDILVVMQVTDKFGNLVPDTTLTLYQVNTMSGNKSHIASQKTDQDGEARWSVHEPFLGCYTFNAQDGAAKSTSNQFCVVKSGA